MSEPVEIDRFRASDQAAVIDLILPIQRAEFGIPITAADQPDLAAIPDFYQTGGGDFWVARAVDVVVGSIGLKDIGGQAGALRKMFVAPAWRGAAGVASRLLDTLMTAARSRGFRTLYLGTTDQFAAAHRFYEKNGFRRVEPAELPEAFPRMKVDTRFYVADLQDDAAGS